MVQPVRKMMSNRLFENIKFPILVLKNKWVLKR